MCFASVCITTLFDCVTASYVRKRLPSVYKPSIFNSLINHNLNVAQITFVRKSYGHSACICYTFNTQIVRRYCSEFFIRRIEVLTVDALMCNYPLYSCSYTAYGAQSISIICLIMTGDFVKSKLNEGNQDFQRCRMGRTLTNC